MSEITVEEYRQLVGPLALAKHHEDHLQEIVKAAQAITGEEDGWGHTADAVYDEGHRDASELLDRLGVTVAAPEPTHD